MIDIFQNIGLDDVIMQAINELGYVTPTAIQSHVIPYILENDKDLIARAETGSGKTAAFGLPLLQLTDRTSLKTQTLILCPTRELCMQISNDLKKFCAFMPEINIATIYGGADFDKQLKELKKGAQFVVGTPGRTLDLVKRKALIVNNIKWLVLDESDEMLHMGFKEDLDAILATTPSTKRTLLFSATMPKEIQKMAEKYMGDYQDITVGEKNAASKNVIHEYYMTQAKFRFEALKRIVDMHPKIYGIIFCRTRIETKEVADKLIENGYNADALHGDLSQEQRSYVMNRFRQKHLQLLVATDVAARGLDVKELTHVINYNLPDEPEVYTHRSGRTGRAGKKGISIAIIHSREKGRISTIEHTAKIKFEYKPIPAGRDICEKQLFNLIDKIECIEVNETQISDFLPVAYKKLSWLTREELIKHILSLEFNRFLKYYENAPDLNISERERERDSRYSTDEYDKKGKIRKGRSTNRFDHKGKDNREPGKEYTRFFISLGSLDDLTENKLNELVKNTTKNKSLSIAKTDIMKNFSFFETEKKHSKSILESFYRARGNTPNITVEESLPRNNDRKQHRGRNKRSR